MSQKFILTDETKVLCGRTLDMPRLLFQRIRHMVRNRRVLRSFDVEVEE